MDRGQWERAARQLRKPVAAGDAEAMHLMSIVRRAPLADVHDRAEAERLLRAAATAGYAEAQVDLAGEILAGGFAGDAADAVTLLESAAGGGSAEAARRLAELYERGESVPASEPEALRWYRACAGSDAGCAVALADAYDEGRGVERDDAAAVDWLRRAGELGSVGAEVELARRRLAGRGLERDPGQAIRQLERLAPDSMDAREALAEAYLGGEHVPRDPERAFELATGAESIARVVAAMTDEELVAAGRHVGHLYHNGDYGEAIDRARAVAHRGDPEAQRTLGFMLAYAYGAPQDFPQALKWLELSGSDEREVEYLSGRLREGLGEETSRRVDEVVAAWQPAPWDPADEDRPVRRTAGEGGVSMPVVVERTPPEFPESARIVRESGFVVLSAVVSRDGHVLDLYVLRSTNPRRGFEQAALQAVAGWRYEPARLDGKPVEVNFVISVDFDLR